MMKPTGFLRYLYYKGARTLYVKRSKANKRHWRGTGKDKVMNRSIKRSERHLFREYLKRFELVDNEREIILENA